MPPTETIAGKPPEAHRCFDVAVVLPIETRTAVGIVAIEEGAVGIAVATAEGEPWQYNKLPGSTHQLALAWPLRSAIRLTPLRPHPIAQSGARRDIG
jgi:hypothetical protein